MNNNKSIKLHPVSKEEVDRILKGEMIELSNAACGSAGCGGCGSCGGSEGSCGGSAGCGGSGGCCCGSGSGDETTTEETDYEGKKTTQDSGSYNNCGFSVSVTISYKVHVTLTKNQFGHVEDCKTEIIKQSVKFTFKGSSYSYKDSNGYHSFVATVKENTKDAGSSMSASVSGKASVTESDYQKETNVLVSADARLDISKDTSPNLDEFSVRINVLETR